MKDNAIIRMGERLNALQKQLEAEPVDCPIGLVAIQVAIATSREKGRAYADHLGEMVLTLDQAKKAFRHAQPADRVSQIIQELDSIICDSLIPVIN